MPMDFQTPGAHPTTEPRVIVVFFSRHLACWVSCARAFTVRRPTLRETACFARVLR